MPHRLRKISYFLLCFLLIFEQSGFAQVVGQLDISGYITGLRSSLIQDKFRPLHLRYLSYDNLNNTFKLLLDKGDSKDLKSNTVEQTTKELLNYFFVGVTLPNDSFWVNLRPDSPDNIIDPALGVTDVGKILLEADLQLKKDTAKLTSPETPEGKKYWDKLYKKAEEILGYENSTIPTLTRPWIVPDEIIIRETPDNAYIYKATLKVMLEQDYLKDSATYNFKDERLKQLNEYSSQLIRELIIPKLTKEVNNAKRYAPLRQVYYSLILAQWFKQKFYGKGGLYSWLIDKKELNGLTSKTDWSKTTYFKEYQKSFKDGEYNIQEPIYNLSGKTIRSYFSGGISFMGEAIKAGLGAGGTITANPKKLELPKNSKQIKIEIKGGDLNSPGEINITNKGETFSSGEVQLEKGQPVEKQNTTSSKDVLSQINKGGNKTIRNKILPVILAFFVSVSSVFGQGSKEILPQSLPAISQAEKDKDMNKKVKEIIEKYTEDVKDLVNLGREAIPYLIETMRSKNWRISEKSVRALRNIALSLNNDPIVKEKIVPVLIETFEKHENTDVRIRAIQTLGEISLFLNDPLVRQKIIDSLIKETVNNEDWMFHQAAGGSLGSVYNQLGLSRIAEAFPNNYPKKGLFINIAYKQEEIVMGDLSVKDIFAIYSDPYFISETKDLSITNQYSIARAIELSLKRFGLSVTHKDIKKALPFILSTRDKYSKRVVLGEDSSLIVICHEEVGFDPLEILNFTKDFGVRKSQIFKGKEKKEDMLTAISNSPLNTTIWFDGHGTTKHFWLKGSSESNDLTVLDAISYKELAEALISRAKIHNGQLSDLTIMIDCCYSANFIVNTLNYLSKAFNKNEINDLPVIITSVNRGGEAGYRNFLNSVRYSVLSVSRNKGYLSLFDIYNSEEMSRKDSDFAFFLPMSKEEFGELTTALQVGRDGSTKHPSVNPPSQENKEPPDYIQLGSSMVNTVDNPINPSLPIIDAQIGKRAKAEITPDNKLKITDSKGNIEVIDLTLQGELDINSLKSQIESMQDIEQNHKQLILAILSRFEKSPSQLYTFSTLVEDLFGVASSENNLIALHESLAKDPVALFHETGEYLIQSNALDLTLQGGTLNISINGQQFSLILQGETLAIAQKDPANPHYLLRALQRELFGEKDKVLTQEIKERQKLKEQKGFIHTSGKRENNLEEILSNRGWEGLITYLYEQVSLEEIKEHLRIANGGIDPYIGINVDLRMLTFHEQIEIFLINKCGYPKEVAHKIALSFEKRFRDYLEGPERKNGSAKTLPIAIEIPLNEVVNKIIYKKESSFQPAKILVELTLPQEIADKHYFGKRKLTLRLEEALSVEQYCIPTDWVIDDGYHKEDKERLENLMRLNIPLDQVISSVRSWGEYLCNGVEAFQQEINRDKSARQVNHYYAKDQSQPKSKYMQMDLGAQVSNIKRLDNLLRILNVLRKSENVPEISESASDREIIEFCINELKAQGLIEEITDENDNTIIKIKKEAESNRLAQAVREWAIDKDGGVKAINFQGSDDKWKIVGFEAGLNNKDTLEHEQKEIAYRKQGYSWIEAHNMAGGQIIDEESAKKYKAGRQDEVGAAITREMIQDWKRSVEEGREALRKGDLDTAFRIYKEMKQLESKLPSEDILRPLRREIKNVTEKLYEEDKFDVDSLLKRVDIEERAGEIIQNGVLRGAESGIELTKELDTIIKASLGQYAQTKVVKASGGYDGLSAFLLMHWHPCDTSGFIKLSDADIDYNPENRWVMAIWGTEFDGIGFYATVYDKKTKETRYYALLPENYNLPITRTQGYRFFRIDEKEAREKEQKIETNQQSISKDQTKTIFWASYNEIVAEYKRKDNLINEVEKAIQELVEDRAIEIENKNGDRFQVKGFFEFLDRKIPKDYQYDFYAYREISRQKTILAGRLSALFKTRKTAQENGERSKNKQIDSWEVFFNEAMPWYLSDIFGEPKRNSHKPDLPLVGPSPTGTGDEIPVIGQAEGGMVTPDILKEWIKEGEIPKLVAHITRGLQGQDDNAINGQIKFIIDNLEESKRSEFMQALKEKGNIMPVLKLEEKQDKGPGGIDFRAMPIVTQPMQPSLGTVPLGAEASPLAGLPRIGQAGTVSVELDNEWQQIQNMLNVGMIPSSERIKEYLQDCSREQDFSQDIDKILSCITDILRLEEERVSQTEPALKELLVLLESDRPANELQLALSKITVLPSEPKAFGF